MLGFLVLTCSALVFVLSLSSGVVDAFGPICNNFTLATPPPSSSFVAGAKVAFVGDQGISSTSSVAVLKMVREWGADPLVILGDFDYVDSPIKWEAMLNNVLGESYPILAVGGNHDVPEWSGYQAVIEKSLGKSGLNQYCTGTFGVDMACDYKGILFVLNQVGTQGSISTYVKNTETILQAKKEVPFKFCGWHKNQHIYQTGSKEDETGFEILEVCRRHGAVVATAHEHSYSRTVLLSDFTTHTIVEPKQTSTLQMRLGESFVFVTGLGGKSIREWVDNAQDNPWWASCASSDNDVNYGALLCTFTDSSAQCEQRDINGKVWDTFTILPPPDLRAPVPPPRCRTPFMEYAAAEDLHQSRETGRPVYDSTTLGLTAENSRGRKLAFRFEGVHLTAADADNDRIHTAHLQLFGVGAEKGLSRVWIRGEYAANSASFEKSKSEVIYPFPVDHRRVTRAVVEWTKVEGEEEWETGMVWVSPNVAEILREIVSHEGWKEGNAVTFIVEGDGAQRRVFTRDHHLCVAPTLAIELESECNDS